MLMEKLIRVSEVLDHLGIPPHAHAGFLSAGTTGLSEKTIRRTLTAKTQARNSTSQKIELAALAAFSNLTGRPTPFTHENIAELRSTHQYERLSQFEKAWMELVEQERSADEAEISPPYGDDARKDRLKQRIQVTIFILAGFELASCAPDNLTLYWCDLLPQMNQTNSGKIDMPLCRWFDQVRVQFEKGTVISGLRASEQGSALSLFDSFRIMNEWLKEAEKLPESERERFAARIQPRSSRRIHRRKLPYTAVERELGLAPKQASRWANASRPSDLPGWKALLSTNQRMSKLMRPELLKVGPNLPGDLLVARWLHAFCLDCLERGATRSMLESMEAWYVEAAQSWYRYLGNAEKQRGQNPLLELCPPSR